MTRPSPFEPVKLVIATLWSDADLLGRALDRARVLWGEIDFVGVDHRFDVTDYYEAEMGPEVKRRLISFEELVDPSRLAAIKLQSIDIEAALARDGDRLVNLDVGTLDHHKLVLASAKPAGQKVALEAGIYADPMFRYRAGRLEPFEWCFPDWRDGRYESELLEMRRRYMAQLRERRGQR